MANIYFKHLSLTNFMSYEKASIDLNRLGNVLVGGINNNPDDSAKSNGCGKSSLFSAISWCLTGETVSGATDVSNIYSEGKTEVSLTFDIDKDSYEIRRTKNPSNLFIYINGENKSGKGIRDTSKLLAEYIPQLTSSLINSVIILGQGLPQRFTNNTPAGRKEVLEKLSNSDFMILDLKDKLTSRKKILDDKKRLLEDENLTLSTKSSVLAQENEKLQIELNSLNTKISLEQALAEVELELDEIEEHLANYENVLNNFNEDLKLKIDNKNKLQEEYTNELSNIKEVPTTEYVNNLISIKSEIGSLESKIRELDNVTDICPTCGQKLPNVEKIDTSDLKKEVEAKLITKQKVEAKIAEIDKQNSEAKTEISNRYSTKISQITSEINFLNEEIAKVNNQVSIVSKDKIKFDNEHIRILNEIEKLDDNRLYRENKIRENTESINNISKKLYNNNEELTTINERLSINSKMLTLIKRDFRGYLLNNIISFIEDRAKIYSVEVFGTDKLSFELANNNINISYDNRDYSLLSGGEKQKLDIIIQFAIRDMLCTFLDFSSNLLILDEITDSLDSIGVSKVFNLISSHLNDVEVVYIISHHVDELEIPADDEIIIIKGDDKISRIV